MKQDIDDIFGVDVDEFGGFDESDVAVVDVVDEDVEKPVKENVSEPVKQGVSRKVSKDRTYTRSQKAIRLMMRRAGIQEIPKLEEIMDGKQGVSVPVTEIGIFSGAPKDQLISELATDCMVGNTLNFSAEISKARVLQIGSEILRARRMYTPIFLARVKENGSYQCVSGRHRLVFLILVYGSGIHVPAYVEDMTLEQARDATGVANDNRPAKAKERAELAVLRATRGKSNIGQNELYSRMADRRTNAVKYAVYSVMERSYPLALSFPVSSVRTGNGLTTLSNVEVFLSAALEWTPETTRKDFDKDIEKAIMFLNVLVEKFHKEPSFVSADHLTAKTMTALGQYHWNALHAAKQNPLSSVEEIVLRILAANPKSLADPNAICQMLWG